MMFYTIFLVRLAVLIGGIVMLFHRIALTAIQTGYRNGQTKKKKSNNMVRRKELRWKNVKQENGFRNHQIKNKEKGTLFGGIAPYAVNVFIPNQNMTEKNTINTVEDAER